MANKEDLRNEKDPLCHVDLLNDSREALLDSAATQLRLIYELKRSQRAGAAQPGAPVLPRMIASEEGSDLLFDLARLSVQSYNNLMKITSQHFDGIMNQLRNVTGTGATEPPTPPRIILEVSGSPGHTEPTKPFCIENPFRVPVEVSFSDPAFCLTSGPPDKDGERFHTRVRYLRDAEPHGKPLCPGQSIALASGDQVKLHAEVTLSESFKRGQQYLGEAYVLSQGRVSGLVCFKVHVRE